MGFASVPHRAAPRRSAFLGPRRSVLFALALLGCAHARSSQPPAGAVPSGPPRPNPTARRPEAAPRPEAAAPGPRRPDPSEEITPEELASIPDPVPPRAGEAPPTPEAAGSRDSSGSPSPEPTEAAHDQPRPEDGSASSGPGSGPGAGPDAGTRSAWVWRVQVSASPDLSEASRSAKDASARLGVPAHIEWEAPLYKVRLGDYASEQGALDLRDRAVRAGYPGAFRVRCAADTTTSKE